MSHLTRLMQAYSDIAEQNLDILYRARAEIRGRAYSPTDYISDSWSLWLNGLDALYVPFEESGPYAEVLELRVKGRQDEVSGSAILWGGQPDGRITKTRLRAPGTNKSVPKRNIKISFDEGSQRMRVRIEGLRALKLTPDRTYIGRVRIDDEPVLDLRLMVRE